MKTKATYIVIIVVMLFIGPLIWFANDAWVDTWYIMEYAEFDVILGEDNQFRKLDFDAKGPDRHSPFRIRLSPTQPSFPILELPEGYIAKRSWIMGGGSKYDGLSTEETSNHRYYWGDPPGFFDFQNGNLTGAMIVACEVSTDLDRGFNRLQGTREHVEACLGPPLRVKRIDNRKQMFKFGAIKRHATEMPFEKPPSLACCYGVRSYYPRPFPGVSWS